MIISHKYRYLFVELPHTGSTAISNELRTLYHGRAILHKHATYHEFLRVATPQEKQYFVFSAIRNPADDVVSYYFKYRHGKFTFFNNRRRLRRLLYWRQLQKAQALIENEVDFPTFFLNHYRLPYDNWSALAHHDFDFVLRFEQLSDDFSAVLAKLGIEEMRRLPVRHKTPERQQDFWSYYTPETWEHAKQIFGPFMQKWDYTFPAEWGEWSVSPVAQMRFEVLRLLRKARWLYVRPFVHRILSLERSRRVLQSFGLGWLAWNLWVEDSGQPALPNSLAAHLETILQWTL